MTRQGFANGTPEPGRTIAEKEATLKRIGEGLTVDELEVIRQNFAIGSDPKVQAQVKKLLDEGNTIEEIAKKLKISRSTVSRTMRAANLSPMADLKTLITESFDKLEKELGRPPTLGEIEKDTGKTRKTILNNIDKELSSGTKLEGGKAGLAAAKKFFKERTVDKPTPVFEGNPGKLSDVKFANPGQEEEYVKLLTERYKYPKGSREGLKLLTNEDLAKKFGMTLNNVERVNSVIANKNNLTYPAQTYEGEKLRKDIRDKQRKADIKTVSDPKVEKNIKDLVKELDPTALRNDIDLAHRASLKANALFGGNIMASNLGLDPKIVNQELVRSTEQKLGKLYDDQKKLIKNLKPGKFPKDVQKKLNDINATITRLALDTDGALQGVLMNEKTGKVQTTVGTNYAKVLGMGLIDDKPVKNLNQADFDLIKLNLANQIEDAKKGQKKLKLSDGPELGAMKGLGKAALNVLQVLGTPSAAAGFAGLSVMENLKEGKNLADAVVDKEVGVELLFPELAKRAVGKVPGGSGILSQIGRVAANPFFRAARAFTPVGAAITAGGLAKDYGRFVKSEIARKAADPEAYIAEQEEQMGIAAADGGLIRARYAEGSDDKEKIDKGRRRVVKILGGIASLPIIGRFFDIAKLGAPAVEKVAEKVAESGVPDYFWKLYNTIKSKGILSDEVKVDPRVERTTTYKNYKLEEGAYGDPSETVITKINDRGEFGYTEESMRFKKGGMDEDGFVGNEYEEITARPDAEGKLKDVEDGLDDGSVDEILEEIGEKTKID